MYITTQNHFVSSVSVTWIFMHIHWASKETYNFLEWCPLKSTASKWMIFGLMLATVLLITHVKKQKNRMCQKWDKCLQITTSPISKWQKLLPFHPHRLSDISIAIHSNSIAGSVHNRFAVKQTYCEHDYVPRYWIWMNSYWNVRKSARVEREQFLWILKLDLLWFGRHLSHFWHIWFLCFLTWVMRRTVANINPKIIHFDAVDFSGHHSKKLMFLLTLSVQRFIMRKENKNFVPWCTNSMKIFGVVFVCTNVM